SAPPQNSERRVGCLVKTKGGGGGGKLKQGHKKTIGVYLRPSCASAQPFIDPIPSGGGGGSPRCTCKSCSRTGCLTATSGQNERFIVA
ncbi:unnamed protein product, partial [Ectocarpus sp. 4 AP-2014]